MLYCSYLHEFNYFTRKDADMYMKKIDELIKRDIESGEIELVPQDKIFDFLPKKEDTIRIMSFNIRCGDVGVQTAESRYTLVSSVNTT